MVIKSDIRELGGFPDTPQKAIACQGPSPRKRVTIEELSQQHAKAAKAPTDGLIIFTTPAHEITFANDASATLFGYNNVREMIGKTWETLFSENEGERLQKTKLFSLSSNPLSMKSFGKRIDGTPFEIEISASRTSTGETIWVIHDIAASKQPLLTERALHLVSTYVASSTLNFNKTAEALIEVIINTGLADWSVVYIVESEDTTSRAIGMHRQSAHQENMRKLSKFTAPKLEPGSPADRALRAGKSVTIPRFAEQDFKRFSANPEHEKLLKTIGMSSAIMVPLFLEGKFVGGVSFIRSETDITYSREDANLAEEIVKLASISLENAKLFEKAQNAVIARNDFVAMVSHDLKNPLSAILLNAAFILRGLNKQSPEKDQNLKRQIEVMERSAQRMNSLIADFLDLARIEASRLVLDRQFYKLQTLIRDTLDMLQPLALAKKITLHSVSSEDLPEAGFFDRERIFQVLSNIIGNAIKFTSEEGSIELGLRFSHSSIVFSVRDSGPGISNHLLAHVFDRYWQAKENVRAGSGLGLYIAKGIVEAHDGRIWVESETGHGSTFFFSLPHPLN